MGNQPPGVGAEENPNMQNLGVSLGNNGNDEQCDAIVRHILLQNSRQYLIDISDGGIAKISHDLISN